MKSGVPKGHKPRMSEIGMAARVRERNGGWVCLKLRLGFDGCKL